MSGSGLRIGLLAPRARCGQFLPKMDPESDDLKAPRLVGAMDVAKDTMELLPLAMQGGHSDEDVACHVSGLLNWP